MDKSKLLELYIQAINHIDDYFEYCYESTQDKRFVLKVLNGLTEQIKELQEQTK